MTASYMFRFKNDLNERDFELDVWRILNFVKTQTGRTLKSHEYGITCSLLKKLKKDECRR